MDKTIEQAFIIFLSLVKEMMRGYYESKDLTDPEITFSSGKKYWKVIKSEGSFSRSVFCFVDKQTGNILKPANWSRPAKGMRGNVTNPDNGINAVTPHGCIYFR